jgi:RNA polymerase sigma-70 factor (ECF subfamily)
MNKVKLSYENETDEQLVSGIAAGSKAAFNTLYQRYGQKMYSYFYRMLWQNHELAEDQVQELFIRLFRYAHGFNNNRSFSTWLYSIAHNQCKNEYRKAAVKMKHKPVMNEAVNSNAEKNPDLQKFKSAIQAKLNLLPEEKKTLFILRFEEQLSVPVISNILELPEGTVKSRIFYLLKELRDELSAFKHLSIYP